MLRPAQTKDVPALGQLINDCAEQGLMLHRSFEYLYEHVRDFVVYEDQGQVRGVCGGRVVWANIAEVYALAVSSDQRGKGVGSQLVQACINQVRQLGVRQLMTLTYEQTFFQKLGFTVLDRNKLPLKVWSECVRCAKKEACDEIAMMLALEDVPHVQAPKPVGSVLSYAVPVTLTINTPPVPPGSPSSPISPGSPGPHQKLDEAY